MSQFALFLAVSSLAAAFMASMPALAFLLAVIWGVSLIVSTFYLDKKLVITIFVINTGIILWLAGSGSLIFYLSFFGIAALVMAWQAINKQEYYHIQKWGILTVVITVSVFIGLMYVNTGDIGISQVEKEMKAYLDESIKLYEQNGLFEFYEEQGITRDVVEQKFNDLVTAVSLHLPAFYYLQAILVVFFMLFFASYVSLKRGLGRLNKRPFNEEVMPWQLVWVFIIGLALWLLGRDEASYIYYAGSNILAVLAPISIYFGLSALLFKLSRLEAGRRRWMIVILIILTLIFSLSILIFLSLIGLFDALLDYRKLRTE